MAPALPPSNRAVPESKPSGVDELRPLVIGCGALAGELRSFTHFELRYLSSALHNRPEKIVPMLEPLLARHWGSRPIFVAYADCGTGGGLDELLARYPGVERLAGSHCYEVFAGGDQFARLHEQHPGTFYLTDFLARNFKTLVWRGLGLDRYPHLLSAYFSNYVRVVLLTQSAEAQIIEDANEAAARLGLPLEVLNVGAQRLERAVSVALTPQIDSAYEEAYGEAYEEKVTG